MKLQLFMVLIFSAHYVSGQYHTSSIDTSCKKYYDTIICDNYEWLEVIDSERTQKWIEHQEEKTVNYFANEKPQRKIRTKIRSYNYFYRENFTIDGNYFFDFFISKQNEPPSLYYKENYEEEYRLLINPVNLKKNKEDIIIIQNFKVSHDNKYVAIFSSKNGSDWFNINIVDLNTSKVLSDEITNLIFSDFEWGLNGFFYSRFHKESEDSKNNHEVIYYHQLGTSTQEDKIVYKYPKISIIENWFTYYTINNGKYLILHSAEANIDKQPIKTISYFSTDSLKFDENKIIFKFPMSSSDFPWVCREIDGDFVLFTNLSTPKYNLLKISKDNPNKLYKFLPDFTDVLKDVIFKKEKIVSLYYSEGAFSLVICNYNGEVTTYHKFKTGFTVSMEDLIDTDDIYVKMESFFQPTVTRRLNIENMTLKSLYELKTPFNTDNYQTDYIVYKSKDGMEIPMYLTYKKGIKKSGNNSTLLYGYGGFEVSNTPFFSLSNIYWLDNGGILAVPGIRGGGELGNDWHRTGIRLNKQNSFDDFIYAANYLIDSLYTNPEKLVIYGASNGGLLVGASISQRPELFRVAIANVGLYDMIKYEDYDSLPLNHIEEYGTIKDSIDFKNLLSYSPYHNIKKSNDYPATLIITAENDERVSPIHSFKFVAKLNEMNNGNETVLLKYNKGVGHQGAETWGGFLDEITMIFDFINKNLE